MILVGPPGSGKTSTYQVLAQILNQIHEDSLQDEANAFDQTAGEPGAESATDGEDTESSALSSVMHFYLISA